MEMKSEIDLSGVSNAFSAENVRLGNIDRGKRKKIIFPRNFILPFIYAIINITYVESDESTFSEASARSIASLNHPAARIKKRRKGRKRWGERKERIFDVYGNRTNSLKKHCTADMNGVTFHYESNRIFPWPI